MTQIMLGSALEQVARPLADFCQKLSGPDGNTKWLPAFKRFLRGENPWDGKPLFTVWKTIVIGVQPKNAEEMLVALKEQDVDLGWGVETALKEADYRQPWTQVHLTRVFVRDLGFPNGAPYAVVKRRALELGLKLCTMQVVATLRLTYTEQDEEELLECLVPTSVKVDGETFLPDLRVDEETGHLYIAGTGEADNLPGPDVEICFVLPPHLI